MGVDAQIEAEGGRLIERLGDAAGCLAKLLVMADARASTCLRFIDPYGDTIFNSLQLPVLESEVSARLADLDISRLRADRKHQLAEAIRLRWQPTVIEDLRKALGDAVSDRREVREVKAHVSRVLALIGRARNAGAHTYLRFIGD